MTNDWMTNGKYDEVLLKKDVLWVVRDKAYEDWGPVT